MGSEGCIEIDGFKLKYRTEGSDKDRLMRFVTKYLGQNKQNWNPWFIENIVDPLDAMIRLDPESVVAKNVSFFKTGPNLAS